MKLNIKLRKVRIENVHIHARAYRFCLLSFPNKLLIQLLVDRTGK